jgi:hypothetical protein
MNVQNVVTPKGRYSDARSHTFGNGALSNSEECRPVGADALTLSSTQGSAALHPGLWNLTPSGSETAA